MSNNIQPDGKERSRMSNIQHFRDIPSNEPLDSSISSVVTSHRKPPTVSDHHGGARDVNLTTAQSTITLTWSTGMAGMVNPTSKTTPAMSNLSANTTTGMLSQLTGIGSTFTGTPVHGSGLSGLAAVSSSASNVAIPQQHTPISIHYGGPSLTVSQIVGSAPSKNPVTQNYIVSSAQIPSSARDSCEDPTSLTVHVTNPMSSHSQVSVSGQDNGNTSQSCSNSNTDLNMSGPGSQSEQRLKVEDALNYLDQVKYKFGNQPQIYNDFLDIMKEFKSQSIDTPGVIARVSNLFRGHPELIVGFNTFLPPGYKIEIQTNDQVSVSMIGQGGGYVVTTVQTGVPPGSTSHGSTQPTSTIIQQHNMSGLPIRSAAQHPHHGSHHSSGSVAQEQQHLHQQRPGSPTASSALAPSTNNFETTPASTFTHSFSSPFVQSAFPSLQTQPVEFNHAINYVNKIKNRFQGQPDKYKQFLEILHTYQKEQRNIKEGLPPSSKHLTEHEVYSQVAKLFEHQDDLLQEFGQFLPDATNHQNTVSSSSLSSICDELKSAIDQAKKSVKLNQPSPPKIVVGPPAKRPTFQAAAAPPKKVKLLTSTIQREVSLSEAGRYGTLNEFAFFDKVRHTLKAPEVYDNFLRCLSLYIDEVLSRSEVLQLVSPFLVKHPELHNWFKDFVGMKEPAVDPVPQNLIRSDKLPEELVMEIDFSTCKRFGASYCALPKNHFPPRCTGRTPLCKEVLNDVWVSFPTWSEDTTFSNSRKTQFEEYIYRCEDERFELDVVIETNSATIRVFEAVAKKMSRMSAEELNEFRLDECLGGSSPTIHQRAVRRLYGEKAGDIIEGLKRSPPIAIPIVLRRLKSKEEEWRESQKTFNKIWREQVDRFYLKSLDHMGLTFKQGDIRALRSKALLSEIEAFYDERQEQNSTELEGSAIVGPHLSLMYKDRTILDDACNLLLHHVRRQSGIQKEDKRKIKQLLKHFIADLFHHTRMELSDDENDEGCQDEPEARRSPIELPPTNGTRNGNKRARGNGNAAKQAMAAVNIKKEPDDPNSSHLQDTSSVGQSSQPTDDSFSLIGSNDSHESRRTQAKRELKQQAILNDSTTRTRDSLVEQDEQPGSSRETSERKSFGLRLGVSNEVVLGSSNLAKSRGTGARRIAFQEDMELLECDRVPRRVITLPRPDEDEAYTLFYASNSWYVFLRLHQILCERLTKMHDTAVKICMEGAKENCDITTTAAYKLGLKNKREVEPEDYYPTFLEMVRNLLDGNMDANAYEDALREMFTIHAYVSYTMDKLVGNAVRQLQTLVTDDVCQKVYELYNQSSKHGGAGGFYATMVHRASAETWYQKSAEKICSDESCVKVIIYKKQCRMTMELLESEPQTPDPTDQRAKYSAYLENFASGIEDTSVDLKSEVGSKPVFLPRNIRKWKQQRQQAYQTEIRKCPLPDVKEEPMDDYDDVKEEYRFLRNVDGHGRALKIEASDDSEEGGRDGGHGRVFTIKTVRGTGSNLSRGTDLNKSTRLAQLVIEENLQCRFNPTTYKMVFVVHTEDFMHLKGALRHAREKHREISLRLYKSFHKWHEEWLKKNVTPEQIEICEDWLESSEQSPTHIDTSNNIRRAPYRPIRRFVVKKFHSTSISH